MTKLIALSLFLLYFLLFSLPANAFYARISWDIVSDATSYKLYWGPTSGSPIYSYNVGNVTDYQIPLNDETTYMTVTALNATGESVKSSQITISPLLQDGYPTPHQISIFLPSIDPSLTAATLRYKEVGSDTWNIGHDLYRIDNTATYTGFAWTIFDLDPGHSYLIEVTTHSGTSNIVYTALMKTRSLPLLAGVPNKIIPSGSTSAYIESVFNAAVAGDIIQFENGLYNIDDMDIRCSGTADNPIYIRGESRDGVILSDPTGDILYFPATDHVVLENLTISGSGIDNGVDPVSVGIKYYGGVGLHGDITFRYLTMVGVDKGIIDTTQSKSNLAYENILIGNNTWSQDLYDFNGSGTPGTPVNPDPDINEDIMWNDDGILFAGQGNAVFNNTISGFGDSLAMNSGYSNCANHFYRNNITMSGDDGIEADYGYRNISFYDNRVTNSMTLISLDPLYNGPFFAFRNIGINIGRQPFKLNGTDTGFFIYNNTIVDTTSTDDDAFAYAWSQSSANYTNYWGFQNNIIIYKNPSALGTLSIGTTGNNIIDFTNNSWYPNDIVNWYRTGGSFGNLALASTGLTASTPIFSNATKRHTNDIASEIQPFVSEVILGENHLTEIITMYTPILSEVSVNKNSGIEIVGITDGYIGSAPDRGAIIEGRPIPTYGANPDQSFDIYYLNADFDGYTDGTMQVSETDPGTQWFLLSELSSTSIDCNDNDDLIHPGATEICGDGIDQDCSGVDLPCAGGGTHHIIFGGNGRMRFGGAGRMMFGD